VERSSILVVAAAIIHDGRVLLARRAPGRAQGGCWEFPGGKVEPTESAPKALARELAEELNLVGAGLRVRVEEELGESEFHYGERPIRLVCYAVAIENGPERVSVALARSLLADDHDALVWAHPSDFPSFAFAPADLPLLPAVAAAVESRTVAPGSSVVGG